MSFALDLRALSDRRGRYAPAFAPLYIVSVKKEYEGGGGITLPGVWFQETLPKITSVNSQLKRTNPKVDFAPKNRV